MAADCPRCGSGVADLLKIDPGMRLALQASDFTEPVPDSVCANCYSEMSSITSRGAKLRAEKSAKEQNMKILWRNRLKLLKGAKQKIKDRNFKEASALYEKYLRTVEIVFDKQPGQLDPSDFKGVKRKEITALTAVYWDLIKIYDTGSRFDDRIKVVSEQLVKFFPYSKGQANLAKQIEIFAKTCRNPKDIKQMARQLKIRAGSCYIATATYQNAMTPEVKTFYRFREEILEPHLIGRGFIKIYYTLSPGIAFCVERVRPLRAISKLFLDKLALMLDRNLFDR